MQPTIQTIHLIAQYLAATSISFLAAKEDDSHTSLGFNKATARLETHPLNDSAVKLAFDYNSFSLVWLYSGPILELSLDGQRHADIMSWLRQTAKALNFEDPINYKFHYDLPYSLEEDSIIVRPTEEQVESLVAMRKLAQLSCEQFAELLYRPVDIRIWPHHFDTGGYSTRSVEPDFGVGWGMAIPDRVADSMYFYISYYKEGKPYFPDDLPELSLGRWSTNGFTGAILPIREYLPAAFAFFAEVHKAFGESGE